MGYQQRRSAFCTAHVIVETDIFYFLFFFPAPCAVTVPFNWKWTFSPFYEKAASCPQMSPTSHCHFYFRSALCAGIVGYPRWTHLWWDIKEFVFSRACARLRVWERMSLCCVCALLCLLCKTLFFHLLRIVHPLALCGMSLQRHFVIDVNYKVNTTFAGRVHVPVCFARHRVNLDVLAIKYLFFSSRLTLLRLPFFVVFFS